MLSSKDLAVAHPDDANIYSVRLPLKRASARPRSRWIRCRTSSLMTYSSR